MNTGLLGIIIIVIVVVILLKILGVF